MTSRRQFLARTAAMAALPALPPTSPIDPIGRKSKSHLKLSIAAYSYRQLLDLSNPKMDMFAFADLAAEMGCDAIEPTSYWFPKGFDTAYLRKLRQHAFMNGLDISGTAIANDFCVPPGPKLEEELAKVRVWIEHAAVLNAPVIRIFGGNAPKGASEKSVAEQVVKSIESVLPHAVAHGVTLALENHGGITETPEQLLRLVRAVKAPNGGFGVNLDTGNFHGDDPYADIAQLAPYAVNVQVKTEVSRKGKPKEPAHLAKVIEILRGAHYSGYVVLEYEAEPEPLKAIPGILREMRGLLNAPG